MPDADTLAVLRDVVLIVILAAFLGSVVYARLRQILPNLDRVRHGPVHIPTFGPPDAVVAFFLALLLTGSLFSAGGANAKTGNEALTDTEQLGTVAQTVMLDLVLVTLVVGYLRVVREFDPAELFGLRRMRPAQAFLKAVKWMVPTFFIVWAVAAGASYILDGVWPDLGPQAAVKILENSHNPLVQVAMALTAAVVAPLSEEIIFRGMIFGVLKRYTDTSFAGLLSALLFAAIHLHVGYFLPLFALGLLFVAAYEATGCLLVSIFMHALFNGSQELLMLFDGKQS